MLKSRRIVRNTMINAVAAGASVILNLVLTAVLANGLSREQFGTWAFLMVLSFNQGYMGLLDLGMSVSALRAIVRFRHVGDEASVADVLATLRTHYVVVSGIGSVIIALIGTTLLEISGSDVSAGDRAVVLAVLAIRVLFDSLHASNMVLLESASAFGRMRLVELCSLAIWITLVVVVLGAEGGIMELARVYLVSGVLLFLLSSFAARTLAPPRVGRSRWTARTAAELWRLGKWAAFQRVGAVIYAQMDRTILALVLGVELVGDYEIPYKFQAMGVLVLSVFPSAIFPVVARFDSASDRDQLSRVFHRATRWTVGISIPLMLTGIFLSEPLIKLWVGERFTHLHDSVSLFLLWPAIACFHVIGSAVLTAIGETKLIFVLSMTSVVVNLIISLLLAKSLGLNGVILGTVLGYLFVFLPYLKVEMRLFGDGYRIWAREIIRPVVFPTLLQLITLAFLRFLWVQGLSAILVLAFGILLTLVSMSLFIVCTPEYRSAGSFRGIYLRSDA